MELDVTQKIKAYREKAQLSLRDLAVVIGVSASTLCRIEGGEVKADHSTLQRINSWIDSGVKLPEMRSLEDRLKSIENRLALLESK
jgi:transcriptional regulator with XRE-family HTH domain